MNPFHDPFALASIAGYFFPLLAGIAARGRLTPGRRWIVVWSVYSVLASAAQLATRLHGRNLWMGYITVAIDGSLVLLALACFQERPTLRAAFRWAVVVALLAHVASVSLLENRHGFSIASTPLYGLIGLSASLITLVGRSLTATEPLLRQDWFLISAGLAIYEAAYATITPLAAAIGPDDITGLLNAYRAFCAVNFVAYTIVAAGVLCPPSRASVAV